MKSNLRSLIIFMRFPEPGKVKSRLASSVGWHQAAEIYSRLCRRTLGLASEFKLLNPEIDIFIFFTPYDRALDMKETFPGPWSFIPQEGTHLGDRMKNAFQVLFAQGYRHILMVGTDIADLEVSDFERGFEALNNGYAVLGPAADGGFHLIGLGSPCSLPFETEQWGMENVFSRTLQLLKKAGFKISITARRRDIDRPADIQFLQRDPLLISSLSIIVPTLRSPDNLELWLSSLERQLWPGDEIIVCRGSRTQDVTNLLKSRAGRLWLNSPVGRGVQLREGSHYAAGNCLLFLHDDCKPPANFAYHIRKSLLNPLIGLGCFELSFMPSTPVLELISNWANLRSRLFQLPYGDQGLFCRREIYAQAGGIRRLLIMEDVDFVCRCRKLGKIEVLPFKMQTSPKRYHTRGILKASIENHLMMAGYLLGVRDSKLYTFYYKLWGSLPKGMNCTKPE